MSKRHKRISAALIVIFSALAISQSASGETLFATSINTGDIYSVDTVTQTVTPVFNTGAQLDSLFFDPNGRIVYSQLNNSAVKAYNPNTSSNVTLATGLTAPIDMVLEPSLTSFLVSDSTSHLVRISLSGSGVINSLNVGKRPDGVVYDPSGNLFVNLSSGFPNNNSTVAQINPTTGAVLRQTANTGVFLDGLTFDTFTGKLFASDYNNGRIVQIDPTTLAFTFLTPTGSPLSQPDGITSDGNGKLFIASRNNADVIQYDIGTNADTIVGKISGLDDLAPASGLGAKSPEPSSLIMAGIGACALLGYQFRKTRRVDLEMPR